MMNAALLKKLKLSLIKYDIFKIYPEGEKESLLETDLNYFYSLLSQFPWFAKLNDDRKLVIINMSFIGLKRLLAFKDLFVALELQDYEKAAFEMLNTEWAVEEEQRAIDLSEGMRTGSYEQL